jgi:hypothetical protein
MSISSRRRLDVPRLDSRYRRRALDAWKSSQDEAAKRFIVAFIEQTQRARPLLVRLKAGFAAAFGPMQLPAGKQLTAE